MDVQKLHEAEKIRDCEAMRDAAEANPNYTQRCIIGKEKVWFVADTKARMAGHIYSESGVREYGISKCCEFHFDTMFPADEEGDD